MFPEVVVVLQHLSPESKHGNMTSCIPLRSTASDIVPVEIDLITLVQIGLSPALRVCIEFTLTYYRRQTMRA